MAEAIVTGACPIDITFTLAYRGAAMVFVERFGRQNADPNTTLRVGAWMIMEDPA